MMELGRQWKIRKGWLRDIDLNIGIHTGVEYVAYVPSSSGDFLLALGATLDTAKYLSGIASGGQIWATKAVINRVPEKEMKALRFGIFRMDGNRQVFIARYFSRIRDLAFTAAGPEGGGPGDLGNCAVTQIFDRQGHG
jgi:class 3 adenylate cyclase